MTDESKPHMHYELWAISITGERKERVCADCLATHERHKREVGALNADLDDLAMERDGVKHSRTCPNNATSPAIKDQLPCVRCQCEALVADRKVQIAHECYLLEEALRTPPDELKDIYMTLKEQTVLAKMTFLMVELRRRANLSEKEG